MIEYIGASLKNGIPEWIRCVLIEDGICREDFGLHIPDAIRLRDELDREIKKFESTVDGILLDIPENSGIL